MLMSVTNLFDMAKAQTSTPIKNCTIPNHLDQSPIANRTVSSFQPLNSKTISGTSASNRVYETKPTENGHLSDHDMTTSFSQSDSDSTSLLPMNVREPTKSPNNSRKRKLIPTEISSKNHSLKQCLLETLADVIPYHRHLSLRLLMTYTIDNNQSECILIDEILNKNQADKLDVQRLNLINELEVRPSATPTQSLVPPATTTATTTSILNSVLFKKEDLLKTTHSEHAVPPKHSDTHVLDLSVRLDSPESLKCEEAPLGQNTQNPNWNEDKVGKLCHLYDSLSVTSPSLTRSNGESQISVTYSVPISLLSTSTTQSASGNAIITTTTVNNPSNGSNGGNPTSATTTTPPVSTTIGNGSLVIDKENNPVPLFAPSVNDAPKNQFPLIDASSILTLLPLLQQQQQQQQQQHQNQTVLNLLNPSTCFNASSALTMPTNQNATISNAATMLLNQICGTTVDTTPISFASSTLVKPLEQHSILNSSSNSSSNNNSSSNIIHPSGLNNSSIIGFPLFNPFMTSDQLNAVQTLLPSGPLLGATTLTNSNFTSLNLGSATLLNLKDKQTGIETLSIMPSTKSFNQHPVASLISNPLSVRTFSQLINQSNAANSLGSLGLNPAVSMPNSTLFSSPAQMPGSEDEPSLNGQSSGLISNDLTKELSNSCSNSLMISSNSNSLNSIITSMAAASSPPSSTLNHNMPSSVDNLKSETNNTTHTDNDSSSTHSSNNNNNNHFLFGRRLTHSRRFTCNQCRRNFASLADLNRHTLETHNSFRCTICSAHFTQRSNLQRHSLKHVGFKPFTCNLCKKEYYRKDHLVRHIEVTHPNHDPKMNITVHLTSSECLDYLDRLNTGKTTPPSLDGEDKEHEVVDQSYGSLDDESIKLQVVDGDDNELMEPVGEEGDDQLV